MFHLNKNGQTRTTTHTLRTDTTNNQAQTQKPGITDCDWPGCVTQPGGTGSSGEILAYRPKTRNPKIRKSAATTDHMKNTFFLQGAIVFCVTVTKLIIIIH